MKRIITSNECNGFISVQMKSANSITFCGQLPENVKVEHIRIIGDVEINGTKFKNSYIENLDGVVVAYHKGTDEIATAYFLDDIDGIPAKVLSDIQNYILEQFEIECIEVCPCCGK